jgi:hypothetical protein
MKRRDFLQIGLAGSLAAAEKKRFKEEVIAAGSEDRAPRVAVVLSNFAGGEDHFGNKVAGLAEPRPLDARLTPAQVDALVRKAIELGDLRGGNLARAIAMEDWVLVESRGADPAIVHSIVRFIAEQRRAGRISVAGCDADFCARMAAAHPPTRFERVDLAAGDSVELPVPGDYQRSARAPRVVVNCDRRVVIARLDAMVGMAIGALDLFSFHPADYAILCGKNLLVAGMNAVSVDAAGFAILGLDPAAQPVLREAEKKGYGLADLESVWVRGASIEEARQALGS